MNKPTPETDAAQCAYFQHHANKPEGPPSDPHSWYLPRTDNGWDTARKMELERNDRVEYWKQRYVIVEKQRDEHARIVELESLRLVELQREQTRAMKLAKENSELKSEQRSARGALGIKYDIEERAVAESILLMKGDMLSSRHHETKLICENSKLSSTVRAFTAREKELTDQLAAKEDALQALGSVCDKIRFNLGKEIGELTRRNATLAREILNSSSGQTAENTTLRTTLARLVKHTSEYNPFDHTDAGRAQRNRMQVAIALAKEVLQK